MSRLVTVCMFCLLCAGHALCAVHDFTGATSNLQAKERIPEWRTPGDIATEPREVDSHNYAENEPYLAQDLAYRRRNSITDGRRADSAARRAHYLERLNRVRSSQKQTHVPEEAAPNNESPYNNVDSIELHKFEQRINNLNELKVKPHSGLGEKLSLDGSVSDLSLRVPRSVEKSEIKDLEVKQSRVVRDTSEQLKVEPHAYVKKLFKKFGDDESMTMNMSGFEELLRHLELQKLIADPNLLTNDEHIRDGNNQNKCVYGTELVESVHERKPHSHDHGHGHEHGAHSNHQHTDELLVDEETLAAICPVLLYQKVSQTSTDCLQRENVSSHDNKYDEFGAYDESRVLVWVYASLSILVISACGLLGVAVIPIMHKSYYDHLIQFLVALAVGTLCGDALLHLMPHAMAPIDGQEYNHDDGMWKGLAAMVGVIFFYFCEKVLTVVAEWRKKHQKMEKLPTRVRVMREEPSKNENSVNTSCAIKETEHKHAHDHKEDPTTKQCKHKYSEYPYCYDEIRTDTHDDHHVRENRNSRLSVVSSKALERLAETGADEWLLKGAAADRNGGDKPALEMKARENAGSEANHTHAPKDEDSYTVILREHSQAHHGHSHSHGHVHSAPRSLGAVAWMVIAGDGLHNFTDGMAVGAAFAGSLAGGFSTALAVLCHELPHELGDFAVLLKAGMSAKRALAYNMLSSALCAMGMAVGVSVGGAPEATQWLFAAAAGMFLYIALVDMMPELSTSHSKEGTVLQCSLQLLGLCCGVGIMLLIALYEHDLKMLFG